MRVSVLISLVLVFILSLSVYTTESNSIKSKSTVDKNTKLFTGKPVYIDDTNNSIIVEGDKNEEMEFFIINETRILQNGHMIKIREIDTKSDVTVTYKKKKSRFHALSINQTF